MEILRFAHPVQVKTLMPYDRILVEEFVELAELEKDNFIEVTRFDLPVLSHDRGHLRVFIRRYV